MSLSRYRNSERISLVPIRLSIRATKPRVQPMSKLPALSAALAAMACIATASMAQADVTTTPEPSPSSESLEDAVARTTFEINCSGCHELSEATSRRKDMAGWKATVENMVGYGAPIGSQDQATIISYLAENYRAATP